MSQEDPSGKRRKDPLDSRLLIDAETGRVVGDAMEDGRVADARSGREEPHGAGATQPYSRSVHRDPTG